MGSSQGGVCDDDPADHCTGTSNVCVDAYQAATVTCRPSAGQCDVAEMCTGTSGTCPADAFQSATTHCMGSSQSGVCDDDPADHCTGTSNVCVDAYKAASVTCRASAGQCDVAEMCTGTSGTCPADAFPTSRTHCMGSSQGGVCDDDAADHCTGTSNACVDVFQAASYTCRPSAGPCDVAENCTGSSAACPSNVIKANGTPCPDDLNPCTNDVCSGTDTACHHPSWP